MSRLTDLQKEVDITRAAHDTARRAVGEALGRVWELFVRAIRAPKGLQFSDPDLDGDTVVFYFQRGRDGRWEIVDPKDPMNDGLQPIRLPAEIFDAPDMYVIATIHAQTPTLDHRRLT